MNEDPIQLSPSQNQAYASLKHAMSVGPLNLLTCRASRGRTTILRKLHQETGGAFATAKDFIESSTSKHPLALEETLYSVVQAALRDHDTVYVDDIDLIHDATSSCHFYPRGKYVETAMLELADFAAARNKRLIVSTDGSIADSFDVRAFSFSIPRFTVEDYAALFAILSGTSPSPGATTLDSEKIFRFAPKLNAHQIRICCEWLTFSGPLTTERVIEYLRNNRLASNVDLGEVQEVDLRDLRGVDDVLRQLETHIVLPLSDDALSAELGLRPKRGVLLYGPPGTGKTTIGRALAHRLKGKFFLVDGTFIAGSSGFYNRINQVFEAAKDNSPAVIFIDDADAIFEDGSERGLYRYLLTKLDGLESEGTARVCVMMTAMNIHHLPAALVRSGRVELWLEMKLPDASARREILESLLQGLPSDLAACELDPILAATEGFTGADMKSLVSDAKGLYAFNRATAAPSRPATAYFLESAEGVRSNKARYQQAEQAARPATRPAHHFPFEPPDFEED